MKLFEFLGLAHSEGKEPSSTRIMTHEALWMAFVCACMSFYLLHQHGGTLPMIGAVLCGCLTLFFLFYSMGQKMVKELLGVIRSIYEKKYQQKSE